MPPLHCLYLVLIAAVLQTCSKAMSTKSLYVETAKKLRELTHLEGISGLLGWDEMVMLPSQSAGCRAEQKAALAGVIYDKKTNAELGIALRSLVASGGNELSTVQRAVVRDALKSYIRGSAVPKVSIRQSFWLLVN